MKRFLTFQIAFVWIISFGAILWFTGWHGFLEIYNFDINHIPVGALFVIAAFFFGSKALVLFFQKKCLSSFEIILACFLMLGLPFLLFVILHALLSSIGLWFWF